MRFDCVVDADSREFWRMLDVAGKSPLAFRSRMEMGHRPRLYRNGMKEDAATYAGISCWIDEARARREASILNGAALEDGKPPKWAYLVRFLADGHRLHVWADDLGPDGHFTVWGEAQHLASTLDDPVPI